MAHAVPAFPELPNTHMGQLMRRVLQDIWSAQLRLAEMQKLPISEPLDGAIEDAFGDLDQAAQTLRNGAITDREAALDAERPTRAEWVKEHAYP